jgi:GDP-D-mannose dehydratase
VYTHNGPGRETGIHPTIVKTMVKAKLEGKDNVDLEIPSLEYSRDVQHAANWADASMTILQYGMSGKAYNVCYGDDLTLAAFIDELARQTGVSPNVITDPSITKFGP